MVNLDFLHITDRRQRAYQMRLLLFTRSGHIYHDIKAIYDQISIVVNSFVKKDTTPGNS